MSRVSLLEMLCLAIVFMALATPVSAALADQVGRHAVLFVSAVAAAAVRLIMPALLAQGPGGVLAFLSLALANALAFAPLGALLPELFPTEVRYAGAASAYNLGGILGASLARSLGQNLEAMGGIAWVGYYIAAARRSASSRSSACGRPATTAEAQSARRCLSSRKRFVRRPPSLRARRLGNESAVMAELVDALA